MTVIAFILLFIEFTSGKRLEITNERSHFTMARIRTWIEASADGQKCAELIINFLKMLNDRKCQEFIAQRKDPINNQILIKSEIIEEVRKNAEFALFILAAHNGNVVKLLQLSIKYKILKVNQRFMRTPTTQDNRGKSMEEQLLRDVKKSAGIAKNMSLNIELIVKGPSYYMVVTGSDHRGFLNVEKALKKIQDTSMAIRKFRKREKSYHIQNSTLIIPEFSSGPRTGVTFSIFTGENFHPQHGSHVRAVLDIRTGNLNMRNTNWKITEYSRYEKKFMQQIGDYQKSRSKLEKFKGTDKWRLFGEMSGFL